MSASIERDVALHAAHTHDKQDMLNTVARAYATFVNQVLAPSSAAKGLKLKLAVGDDAHMSLEAQLDKLEEGSIEEAIDPPGHEERPDNRGEELARQEARCNTLESKLKASKNKVTILERQIEQQKREEKPPAKDDADVTKLLSLKTAEVLAKDHTISQARAQVLQLELASQRSRADLEDQKAIAADLKSKLAAKPVLTSEDDRIFRSTKIELEETRAKLNQASKDLTLERAKRVNEDLSLARQRETNEKLREEKRVCDKEIDRLRSVANEATQKLSSAEEAHLREIKHRDSTIANLRAASQSTELSQFSKTTPVSSQSMPTDVASVSEQATSPKAQASSGGVGVNAVYYREDERAVHPVPAERCEENVWR